MASGQKTTLIEGRGEKTQLTEIPKKSRALLNETSDTYAEKIRTSSDLKAIEKLLDSVREIEKRRAKILLSEIQDTIAGKIKASTSPELIKSLLDSISKIDNKTAKWLEKETKLKSEEK